MSTRLEVILPDGLRERLDGVRGDVSRSRFVVRALEAALGGTGSGRRVVQSGSPPAEPPRASGRVFNPQLKRPLK